MTSLQFPDSGTRLVQYANGDIATNVTGILYADQTLTTLAEVYADNAGTPGALIGNAQITTDAYGRQPDYWGPAAGGDKLWLVVNGGPSFRVDAAYGQRIDAINTALVGVETTTGSQTKATAAQTAATGAAAALAIVFGA